LYTNFTLFFSFWGISSPGPLPGLCLWPCPHDLKSWVCRVSLQIHRNQGRPKAPPATQNATRKYRATKQIIGNLAGEFTFLFQGKIIKRFKPSKCSKTNLQTSLIPQFFHGDTPDPC